MDGAGFVVPLCEHRQILAASFSQAKWPHRAGEETALFRVFMGGAVQGEVCNLPKPDIAAIARHEIESIVGVTGDPWHSDVTVWKDAMAQYSVGHLDRVARIRGLEAAIPSFALAGNGFEGVGIPDCIASAEKAAMRILAQLER
jgi:oxygen-dependent protoporphyrinogen oxidase